MDEAVLEASSAGIIDGMILAWSTVVTPMLQSPDAPNVLTNDQISWIMSVLSLGAMVGPIITWMAIDRIGRKPTMQLSMIPMIASFVIMVIQTDYLFLIMARIFAGVGTTIALSSIPLYIGEVVEDRIRGAMNAIPIICNSFGQLLVFVVAPYLNFQWLNIMCAISALIVFFTMLFSPESPYYYVINNDTRKATKSLQSLRSTTNVKLELESITDYVEKGKRQKTSTFDLFTNQVNRRAFFILMMVMLIHVLSGSQGIQTYAYGILKDSGYKSSIHVLIVVMGVVSIIASVVGLFAVDVLGRRPLLFLGSIFMLLFLIINGIFYTLKTQNYDVSNFTVIPIIGIIGYNASLQFGLNIMPTVILSEYFSANIKSKAAMLFAMLASGTVAASIKIFAILAETIGLGPLFFVLCIPLITFAIILFFVMPETKCRSLQEIGDIHVNACTVTTDKDISSVELNPR